MLDPVPHLKAAFATNSLTWVDADFAWARHLVVYDLTPSGAELVEALAYGQRRHAAPVDGIDAAPTCSGNRTEGAGASEQMAAKLGLLGERGVLFSTGLSERTAMTLSHAGIFPVVLEQRRPIQDVLTRLQKLMHRDPPLWMCRVLRYGACRHDHF